MENIMQKYEAKEQEKWVLQRFCWEELDEDVKDLPWRLIKMPEPK